MLNLKSFEDWLKSQDREQVVGQSNMSGNCPIARYLLEVEHTQNVRIQPNMIAFTLNGEYQSIETPEWVKKFLVLIDEIYEWDTKLRAKPITADDALHALLLVRTAKLVTTSYVPGGRPVWLGVIKVY